MSLFGQAGIFYFYYFYFYFGEISWYANVLMVLWHEKVVCYTHTSIAMPNFCTILEAIY